MKKKIINLISNIKNEENGAIIILVAVSMVAFMSLLAVTLDVGLAYIETGNLQKAADAAVYSAGRKLPINQADISAINDIKDSAIHYASLNGYNDLTGDNVILGSIVRGKYTTIEVKVAKSVEVNFAKVFGINSINVKRSAKAKLSPKSKMTGVAPIGLLKSTLDTILQTGEGQNVTLKYGRGGGVQGFFGALDLDGKGGGASDYRLWLAHGYPGEIVVGDILVYENGNMVGPTYQGFKERYDSCTHYGATTGGEGCTFEHFDPDCPRVAKVIVYSVNNLLIATVTGFASFVLEDQTDDGYITGSFVQTLASGGNNTGQNAGTNADYGTYSLMLAE